MQSRNKPAQTAAEKRHVAKVAALPCVICGAEPVEVHEPEQGLWFASMPLCATCHRHEVYGWHGARMNWKARKMTELRAINETVRMLMYAARDLPAEQQQELAALFRATWEG